MASLCSDFVLLFNGEIYNYPELRQLCEGRGHAFRSEMDGEVILHLWEDEGPQSLQRLNGIFAIAVLDKTSGTVTLARDPLGVKPVYLTDLLDGKVTFGSEISAIADGRDEMLSRDPVAIAQFLSFLWIPAPRTRYREVRQLRPGEIAVLAPGRQPHVQKGPHSLEFPRELRPRMNANEAANELAGLLDGSVERQSLSDVPIGIMASGGVDSTLIWQTGASFVSQAFTISVPSGSEGLDRDVLAAEAFAPLTSAEFKIIHAPEQIDVHHPLSGDLVADPALGLVGQIAEAARTGGIPVLMSGQGADEILGGYRRHSAAWALERTRLLRGKLPHPRWLAHRGIQREYIGRLWKALEQRSDFDAYATLFMYSTARQRAELLDSRIGDVCDDVVLDEHRQAWESLPTEWGLTKRAISLDLMVYLPGLGLTYTDRAAMEHGVEVRVPWLDLEIVRWSLAQDDGTLVAGHVRKKPALTLARRRLPREVWDRPKRGFGAAHESLPDASPDLSRQQAYLSLAARALDRLDT